MQSFVAESVTPFKAWVSHTILQLAKAFWVHEKQRCSVLREGRNGKPPVPIAVKQHSWKYTAEADYSFPPIIYKS